MIFNLFAQPSDRLYDRDSIKFELKVNKRGAAPDGGGEVLITVPNPKKLRPALALGECKSRAVILRPPFYTVKWTA